MKFHRFPHLVQRELCNLLHPFDLVLLSFCSDRTRRAVKKANKNRKNEIWVSGNRWGMTVFCRSKDRFDYICYVHRDWLLVPKSVICIEIDGVDVGISWKIKAKFFCSINVHTEHHIILMHKYICELFNCPEELYLITNQVEYDFPSMRRSYLQNSDFRMNELGEFYRRHPEQEFSEVRCFTAFSYSVFNCENVFTVRNLILRGTIPDVRQCFRMFKGEHAYFEGTCMWSTDIIHVSEEWMKRTNDGLESVIFKPEKNYDVEELKREIRVISCGNKRKETIYSYKSM
ncbi:hypothetical protein CAEBREN_01135 [Caenorhabditis brenneri]|uniref:F-box domain-containing protein n=1 Tax=Caenorhabditis brenneri TaxID=135651 RepID=G0NNW4_CAEBE|nr:hypothetical protein CAEBREN_01135 [Caenorhabditis brenneri]